MNFLAPNLISVTRSKTGHEPAGSATIISKSAERKSHCNEKYTCIQFNDVENEMLASNTVSAQNSSSVTTLDFPWDCNDPELELYEEEI